jgi:hypothetical protein
MNMVMILIPLLLLSTVFLKAGAINITAPRSVTAATADNEESPEEERVPQVVVFVSEQENDVVRVVADPNIPFEAIVATMDTARYFVEPGSGGAAVPGAGSDASAYALPRGVQGAQALASAAPLMAAEGEAEPLPLFPYPVLLTARPQGAL